MRGTSEQKVAPFGPEHIWYNAASMRCITVVGGHTERNGPVNSWNMIRLLLVWMVACASGISCKPSEPQAVLDGRKVQNDKRMPSKEEMIAIAEAAGGQYERYHGEWKAVIDEGNARWREWAVCLLYQSSYDENPDPNNRLQVELFKQFPGLSRQVWPKVKDDELDAAIAKHWPMLKGRDYQVLWYEERSGLHGEDTGRMICLDKETGKVIVALGQWGDVIEPAPGVTINK
jgi:hypothetical protein